MRFGTDISHSIFLELDDPHKVEVSKEEEVIFVYLIKIL